MRRTARPVCHLNLFGQAERPGGYDTTPSAGSSSRTPPAPPQSTPGALIHCISFGEPQPADDSDLTDEGVVVRLRDGRIVGLTILNATKKVLAPQGT